MSQQLVWVSKTSSTQLRATYTAHETFCVTLNMQTDNPWRGFWFWLSLFLCLTAASGGGLSFENLNTNMQMVKRYLNIYIFNSYIFVIFVAKDDLEYADGQFMQRTLLARLPLGILSVTCILPNGESRPAYYSKIQIYKYRCRGSEPVLSVVS